MGAESSTDASVKPQLLSSRQPAQEEWDAEVARIYDSYDKDKDGVIDRDEVIAQSMQLGEKKEVATAAADAFMSLLGAGDNRISKTAFATFLAKRVIKPGHHNIPYADDVERLRGVFAALHADDDDEADAPMLSKTGHIKLLRQSSMEFRQKRKQCQICHEQRGASALYSLHGPSHKEEKSTEPKEDASDKPLLTRQTSHDFIKSFASSVCRHSFCPMCIQKHVREQLKARLEPLCPVCDEPLVIEDINNLLEEEELVPFLKVLSEMGRDPATSPVRNPHGVACSQCPGVQIQVPETLADINQIVKLVAQLNYDVRSMEGLNMEKLRAVKCDGKDSITVTLHNAKENQFMSGGGGDDTMELASDAETRFCQWTLQPMFEEKVKPNVDAVTMGRSWSIKNSKTGTLLGMEPGNMPEDVRNIMCPSETDPEDTLYTLEWQPSTESWAFKNEATRRYVSAGDGSNATTFAGASTYLMNRTKVFPVSALSAHWSAYTPPKSAFDLVEEFFVVTCPTHGEALCAGCGKAPHLKAKSTPCRACNHLRTAVLLQALQSAVSGKSLYADAKSSTPSKADAKAAKKKKAKNSSGGPKSGIGYGGNSGVDVNTSAKMLAKEKDNRKKASKLLRLLEDLSFCLSQPSLLTAIPPSFYALLHQSDLNKILSDYIRVGSVMEMAKTPGLYINLMELTKILSSNQNFIALLRPDRSNMASELGSHHSPIQLIDGVQTQAKVLLQSTNTEKDEDDDKKDSEEAKLLQFAESVVNTADALTMHTRTYIKNKKQMEKLFAAAAVEGKSDSKMEGKIAERERREVEDLLKSAGFGLVPLQGSSAHKHYFSSMITGFKSKNSSMARNMRIRQEMASLSAGTPPGIFVRFDTNRFDVLHCMIIGADETPYEKGCFLFDMFLPSNYPEVPPKCQFLTTGNGQFRFNANLYSAGKVCLSLLGTWQGPGWDPKISTILQVLLSIQSLIMCPDPIANEPGWENLIGKPRAKYYDRQIRHANMIFAMRWHLEKPPYAFEDAVKAHFWLHKEALLELCDTWLEDSQEDLKQGSSVNYGSESTVTLETYDQSVEKLKEALEKLERPKTEEDSDSDSEDSDSD